VRQTAQRTGIWLSRARRGSSFFVIDAFLAAGILVMTLIIIFSFFVQQRESEQSVSYARDYLNFLVNTPVREYRNPVVLDMVSDGGIADTSVSLAEQAILFHIAGNSTAAEQLLSVAAESIPSTIDVNVTVTDYSGGRSTTLFARNAVAPANRATHLSAKSLAHAVVNGTILYGPYVFEVNSWS